MTWGLDYNGGPYHIGKCPECGCANGDCTDGICEDCFADMPVLCHQCGDHVQPDQMEGSICRYCADFEREGKREEVESVWCEIH